MFNYVVCVSTMRCKILENNALLNSDIPLLIINQCKAENEELTADDFSDFQPNKIEFYNFYELGLSKSRNRALERASAEWVIIVDDDVCFDDNCLRRLINDSSDFDVIVFSNSDQTGPKFSNDENVMRIIFSAASWCIAVKKEFIDAKQLRFDERFGLGSTFISTEENSFLWDAKRYGARIKSSNLPAVTHLGVSTGFDWNNKLWESKGAFFARNLGLLGLPAGMFFIMRKSISYRLSIIRSTKNFLIGYFGFKKLAQS